MALGRYSSKNQNYHYIRKLYELFLRCLHVFKIGQVGKY